MPVERLSEELRAIHAESICPRLGLRRFVIPDPEAQHCHTSRLARITACHLSRCPGRTARCTRWNTNTSVRIRSASLGDGRWFLTSEKPRHAGTPSDPGHGGEENRLGDAERPTAADHVVGDVVLRIVGKPVGVVANLIAARGE